MNWIYKYTLTSKPAWQNSTPDAAKVMSEAAGSDTKAAMLKGRILKAAWFELKRGIPKLVPVEPGLTTVARGEYHLSVSAIVEGLSVAAIYQIVPFWKKIEVEILICTGGEMKAYQQQNPVKVVIMPERESPRGDMPAKMPVSRDI